MTPYLADADVTLYLGDVLDVLREMEDGSVDCVVTSPPYWGLRDYGTGEWEGGDESCDHAKPTTTYNVGFNERWGQGAGERKQERKSEGQYAQTCELCGARRVDQQIGLEPTPDLFVEGLVAVFREVRRVLASHGTCWVNLGDSYASGDRDGHGTRIGAKQGTNRASAAGLDTVRPPQPAGLKPKDLVGIPWRVAFALQADGWWLRSDIVWAKPNPMPESVTDRPTKSHEYVFLLTKQPRYFFDQEAVREPWGDHGRDDMRSKGVRTGTAYLQDGVASNHAKGPDGRRKTTVQGADGSIQHRDGERWPNTGRNIRSVWTVATQPYANAHFATYPEELVRRCVLAGCPVRVCRTCGKPSERQVDVAYDNPGNRTTNGPRSLEQRHEAPGFAQRLERRSETVGWSDCGHNTWRPGLVLDPFVGSGTTCKVARDHGRHSVGIDLNAEYLSLAAKRLSQQSLFSEVT